jgi:hypothetical protein
MSEVVKIKLSNYGNSLGTRDVACNLRHDALEQIHRGNRVLFDFSDIEIISSGFSDELFGKLYKSLGEKRFYAEVKLNGFSTESSMNLIMLIIKRSLEFRKLSEESKPGLSTP